jgi:hypothetical protein
MVMHEELPAEVKELVERGYNRMGQELHPHERNEEYERIRMLARKWRNLVQEARFDIPTCLHPYINWLMPEYWTTYHRPSKISDYEFRIELPEFAAVHVGYKVFMGEWQFQQFDIVEGGTPVSSTRYNDLPLFLALARELKRPKKQQVKIEEIEGGLADNVKLTKVENQLTEADYWNNPDMDVLNPYVDVPIYV